MLNKAPNLFGIEDLVNSAPGTMALMPGGRWVMSRPVGFYSLWNRLRLAWMVFTGRADAITWPGGQ